MLWQLSLAFVPAVRVKARPSAARTGRACCWNQLQASPGANADEFQNAKYPRWHLCLRLTEQAGEPATRRAAACRIKAQLHGSGAESGHLGPGSDDKKTFQKFMFICKRSSGLCPWGARETSNIAAERSRAEETKLLWSLELRLGSGLAKLLYRPIARASQMERGALDAKSWFFFPCF